MDLYAFITGIIVVTYVILRFRNTGLDRTAWAYPLLLASFPVYYFVFALYARDYSALWKESLVGLVFIALAFWAYRSNRKMSALMVAIASILHAVYDAYHDLLFNNPGVPGWWAAFCGSIDIVLGCYLIYYALKRPVKSVALKRERSAAEQAGH